MVLRDHYPFLILYNQEDEVLEELVANTEHPIRKIPYQTHPHSVDNGQTQLESEEGPIPLQIFGQHNMSNLSGALLLCPQMGVEPVMFYEAISSFSGASKRLELFADRPGKRIYRDFAHAPSKVQATTKAVREQFPNDLFLACLELHTFSSLDSSFIHTYANCLAHTDIAVVFIDDESRKAKGETHSVINYCTAGFFLSEDTWMMFVRDVRESERERERE